MEQEQKSVSASLAFGSLTALIADIDDWCGTKPHRPFPPRPHGVKDVLISVAIQNLAVHINDAKLRDGIQSLAAQLYAAGGKVITG
jgi:hypothetical protein